MHLLKKKTYISRNRSHHDDEENNNNRKRRYHKNNNNSNKNINNKGKQNYASNQTHPAIPQLEKNPKIN
jgi:hypothetical protein